MKRGDIVIVAALGDYGKPRPAIVIQSDWLAETDSVLVALVTSALVDAPAYRLRLDPTSANGLKAASQIMVDKIIAMPRAKCSSPVGRIGGADLAALNAMVSVVIGLAD